MAGFFAWSALASSLLTLILFFMDKISWFGLVIWLGLSLLILKSAGTSVVQSESQGTLNKRIDELIEAHRETLLKKRNEALYKDDYGNLITDKWNQEVDYFVGSVLFKDERIASLMRGDMAFSALAKGKLSNDIFEETEYFIRLRVNMMERVLQAIEPV